MKTKSYVIAFLLLLIPISTWASEKPVGVREFMKNSEKYSGEVIVNGVVSKVFPKHKLIAVIDIQEVKECKVITCASLTLPVKWNGDMPKLAETIQITGKIEKENNRMIFIAKELKKISAQ